MRTIRWLIRLVIVGGTVWAALAGTWWVTGTSTRQLTEALVSGGQPSDGWTVDTLAGDVAAALSLVAVAGLATMLALHASASVLGDRARWLGSLCDRITPRACRRIVSACCGIGIAAPISLGAPAMADPGAPPPVCHQLCRPLPARLVGLGLPDLPTGPAHRAEIIVKTGDSLWTIARARLPASASNAEIESLTQRLYTVNRSSIGDDPDLIIPGLTLIVPEDKP